MKNLKPSEMIIFEKLKNILIDYDKKKYTKENMLILMDIFLGKNKKFIDELFSCDMPNYLIDHNNNIYNFYYALCICFTDIGIDYTVPISSYKYFFGVDYNKLNVIAKCTDEELKEDLKKYNYIFLHTEFIKFCNKSLDTNFISLTKTIPEWKKFFEEEYKKSLDFIDIDNYHFTNIGNIILKEYPELTHLERVCRFIDEILTSLFIKDEYIGRSYYTDASVEYVTNSHLEYTDTGILVSIYTLINYAFNGTHDPLHYFKIYENKCIETMDTIQLLMYLERNLNKLLGLCKSGKSNYFSKLMAICRKTTPAIDREENPAKFILFGMESIRSHLKVKYEDVEYFDSARFNLFYSLRLVWNLFGVPGNIAFAGKGKVDPDPEFDYHSEFSSGNYVKDISIAVYLFIYAIVGKSLKLPYGKEIPSFLIDRLFESYQKYYEDYGDYFVGNMTVWREQNDIRILDSIKILINSRDYQYSKAQTILEEIDAINSILNGETSKEVVTNFFKNLDTTKKLFQCLLK